ncbi:MAG: O-Antigen ligase [Pedosphaera sp.]|nr:O-Antigen ligase [Pedosphaera sp.]
MYGVCLPLAVLIGYFLAEPLESGSVAVVILVLAVLSIPLLMRWHHVLLLASWNAVCLLFFLPGNPSLCLAMTFVSLFFSLLDRSIGRNQGLFAVRSVALSLAVLAGVVVITAFATGGLGLRSMGSSTFGGKRYFLLIGGILGYFALAGRRIDPHKVNWYVAVFFLSALVVGVGYLAALSGVDFVAAMFPVEDAFSESKDVIAEQGDMFRLGSLIPAVIGVVCYMLARYGVRGLFDLKRPWRLVIFALAMFAGLACGFRSALVLVCLTFLSVFYWEGLCRPRYLLMLLGGALLASALILPFAHKMPLAMQRTLSFLPINVDIGARNDAEGSTAWRFEIWRQVLPDIPKYFFKGKGYTIDPGDLYMSIVSGFAGNKAGENSGVVSGDYHSGPLSVIIPFGIFGVAAFVWFLSASVRFLYQKYRFGDPALHNINTFLLAFFIVRIFGFVFLFGSLYSEMFMFTGLIGFSVSLNSGLGRLAKSTEPDLELE